MNKYFPIVFNDLIENISPWKNVLSSLREVEPVHSWQQCSGVSLYEDEHAMYLEAALPGVKADSVEVTWDKGGVAITGKCVQERPDVKFHFQSSANYSYWLPLPSGKIDETAKPEATLKDGILKLSFVKHRASKAMKIQVRGE